MVVGSKRYRSALAVCLALFAVGAIAGCGDEEEPETGTTEAEANLPELTLSIGQDTASYAQIFIADIEGLYERAGVSVTIDNNGTNFASVMLSGRAELTVSGPTASFPAATEGKETAVIHEVTYGLPGGILVAADSPYKTLMDLSGKKIATSARGGARYGVSKALSDYIVEQGGEPLDLAIETSLTGGFAQVVVSGTVEATEATPDEAIPVIASGRARWLVPPGSPEMAKFVPPDMVGYSIWTTKDNIAEKDAAVSAFSAGLRLAQQWIADHSDEEVAKALQTREGFGKLKFEDVVAGVKLSRNNYPEPEGFISQERWETVSLPTWSTWGLELDVNDPAYSYDQRVDMTYWNAGTEIVENTTEG
jgi:NitT/TauT family transport system substrate-binding protein